MLAVCLVACVCAAPLAAQPDAPATSGRTIPAQPYSGNPVAGEAEAGQEEIAAAVRSHLARLTCWHESEIDVRLAGSARCLVLPEGTAALRVAPGFAPGSSRRLVVPLEARASDGRPLKMLWASVDWQVRAQIVTVAENVPYGRLLSAQDLVATISDIPDPLTRYIRSPGEAAGRTPRRALAAGTPLSRRMLRDPVLVKSGQNVRITLQRPGLRLAAMAKAEQDGILGQRIAVRCQENARRIRAQVTGPGQARID